MGIIPLASGKGAAVEAILKRLGLTREEAIAFGDGSNDVPMFEKVGTAVAMENSTEEVKSKATVICPSVDDDGHISVL